MGWYHAQRGEAAIALPYCTEALALQQRAGDWENESIIRDVLGLLHQATGEHDEAARHFEEGLRLSRRTGNPAVEAQLLTHLGDLYEGLGDAPTAVERWREAYAILADLGHPQAAALRGKLAPLGTAVVAPGIRGHRLRRGLSQEDLAERTGLSVRTIRNLESGKAGRSRPETARLLADAFGLTGEEREHFQAGLTDRPGAQSDRL